MVAPFYLGTGVTNALLGFDIKTLRTQTTSESYPFWHIDLKTCTCANNTKSKKSTPPSACKTLYLVAKSI